MSRPNVRKTALRECLDAMESLEKIAYRIEGCPDPNCVTCKETKAVLSAIQKAIARATAEETNPDSCRAILRELVDSPNAKNNALWDRARKAVGK